MPYRMRYLKQDILLNIGQSTTVATTTVSLNGILRGVKTKTPAAVDSSATVKIDITDPDSDNIYSKSAIAVNITNKDFFDTQTSPKPLSVPVAGTYIITITYSAAQSTNRTTTVTLLVETFN